MANQARLNHISSQSYLQIDSQAFACSEMVQSLSADYWLTHFTLSIPVFSFGDAIVGKSLDPLCPFADQYPQSYQRQSSTHFHLSRSCQ
jgi:hypothetical protein